MMYPVHFTRYIIESNILLQVDHINLFFFTYKMDDYLHIMIFKDYEWHKLTSDSS